jgi:hypothetical protein
MRWVYAGVYALMGPYAATYAVVYAPHLTECKRLLCHIILSFFLGYATAKQIPVLHGQLSPLVVNINGT